MEHFSAEDWADLVRGALASPKAEPMRSHFEQDCAECVKSFNTWRLIADSATREARYHPPESTVRIAKAVYVPERAWTWLKEVAVFSRLIFDSFRHPSPALLRGSKSASRQLVHESEPFVIDLRLEADPARKRIFLIGQILNTEALDETVSNVDVVLLAGDKLVRRGVVNASGEFDLELNDGANLQLFINIRGQRAIGIALPDLES